MPVSTSGRSPLEVARECAEEARHVTTAAFAARASYKLKGPNDPVTETDLEVERTVLHILSREYPDHGVLSEESGPSGARGRWLWVVDPIDGTRNFARGIPHFCFTIALCFQREPILALTSQPLLREEFLAIKGQGTSLNGRVARVSGQASLADSLVAIDMGLSREDGERQLGIAGRLWKEVGAIRVNGSAALGFAHVAAGRCEAFLHGSLGPWDVAAGLLLVREAGGEVYGYAGARAGLEDRAVVGSCPGIAAAVQEAIGQHRDRPGPAKRSRPRARRAP
jgi:fructose-1,6-bisphosphatase/inositol monophosphatase family enzyme